MAGCGSRAGLLELSLKLMDSELGGGTVGMGDWWETFDGWRMVGMVTLQGNSVRIETEETVCRHSQSSISLLSGITGWAICDPPLSAPQPATHQGQGSFALWSAHTRPHPTNERCAPSSRNPLNVRVPGLDDEGDERNTVAWMEQG
jgi:hypothetical protein